MKRPELLAPAGDLIKLKAAIDYGADAVYMGGKYLSLRTASDNFSMEEMEKGISYAHSFGKKCYIAMNILAHNRDLYGIEEYIQNVYKTGADGVIVSDLGITDIIKNTCQEKELVI